MDRRVFRSRARANTINAALLREEQRFSDGAAHGAAALARHGGRTRSAFDSEAARGKECSRLAPLEALPGSDTRIKRPAKDRFRPGRARPRRPGTAQELSSPSPSPSPSLSPPPPPPSSSSREPAVSTTRRPSRESSARKPPMVGRRAHIEATMAAMQVTLEEGDKAATNMSVHGSHGGNDRPSREKHVREAAPAFRLPVIRVPSASSTFARTRPCSMHQILSMRGDLLADALLRAGFTIEWSAGARPARGAKHPLAAHVGPELAEEFLDFIDGEQNVPTRDEPNLAVSALNVVDAFVARTVSGHRSRWRRACARRRVAEEEAGKHSKEWRRAARRRDTAPRGAYGAEAEDGDGMLDGEGMLPADHGTEAMW